MSLIKYLCIATLALALPFSGTQAQQLIVGADFSTRFDNREYKGTQFPGSSETFFSARLTPYAGLQWDARNRLVIGIELMQDFGDNSKFLTETKPLVYYSYNAPKVSASAGIFEREQLRGDYNEAFFDRSYLFYESRVQGVMGCYHTEQGFVEMAIDWVGMQQKNQREKFRLLSAGRYEGQRLYGGYALTLLHYAKTSDPQPDEGIVDHILVNPFGGVRFSALFDFDIRLGYLQSLQRDRVEKNGWEAPKGGMLDFRMGYKGLSLGNMLYLGENQMPFYGNYGENVYAGSVFFGTTKHIYNRTDISYARRFFHDTLGIRAGMFFHYDGKGLGTSQLLEVNVRLQKIFSKKEK